MAYEKRGSHSVPARGHSAPARGTLAVTVSLLAVACGGGDSTSGPTDPNPPPPDIEVEIGGAKSLHLPASGGVSATYQSLTEGPVSRTTWSIRREDYTEEGGPWTSLGTGSQIEHTFTEMGSFVIRAVAEGGGAEETDLDTTAVLPHFGDVSRPIAFFNVLEFSGGETVMGIYLLDPSSPAAAKLVARDDEAPGEFGTNALSWNPSGDKLALAVREVGNFSDIFTFDPVTKEYLHVNAVDEWAPRGISWKLDWSPVGDWIAYVEDARIPRRASDELVLARPDGSQVLYPAGEEPDEEFYGSYTSFSPDGDRIALGGAKFTVDGEFGHDRVGLYSRLTSGEPERTRLHSEERLVEAYGPFVALQEGDRGVDWSPDGSSIAYGSTWNTGDEGFQRVTIASADGSGNIKILPYSLASAPAWSPNGRFLVFERFMTEEGTFHVFLVDRDGERPIDLSRLRSDETVDDFSPTW